MLEIPDTNDLFSAIDVHASDDGVLMWAGRDDHFDLGVGFGKVGEVVREESSVGGGVSDLNFFFLVICGV